MGITHVRARSVDQRLASAIPTTTSSSSPSTAGGPSRFRSVAGGAHGAEHYSFTGVRTGAPLAFSSTTMNLAGSVLLALRPTT